MGKLLIYLHLAMKQRALQSTLENALAGISVTAVGRIADFDRALASGHDAVLSLPLVLDARGLPSKLQGLRQGVTDEPYVLAGADREPLPGSVSSVGALDLLGRDGTAKFVRGLVPSNPKIERVTKVEDLLPLLQMQRVDCIILPARLFHELQGVSRMNLVMKTLDTRVGLPAAASIGAQGGAILGALGTLPKSASQPLGVDSWR